MADATPAKLHVVAIYHRANGIGQIVLARELALAHAGAALDSAVFVAGGTGAMAAAERRRELVPAASAGRRARTLSAR